MAKARILKRQDKLYIELPQEFDGLQEVEIFQLKEGYYLLSVPLGGEIPQAQNQGGMSQEERAVVRKLLSIRFENRTPAQVAKALSQAELETLKELERRRFVNVFRGDKYKEGVYNISDKIYAMANSKAPSPNAQAVQPQAVQRSSVQANPLSALGSRGFAIITDRREAQMLSEQMASEIRSGSIVGIKGFDGKFYLVTKNYLTSSAAAISAVLKEDMDIPAIAAATRLEQDGCIAVLRLLAENGEIIEKKKGIFAPV